MRAIVTLIAEAVARAFLRWLKDLVQEQRALSKAKKEGRDEAVHEFERDAVEAERRAASAVAGRDRDRDALVERMRKGSFGEL